MRKVPVSARVFVLLYLFSGMGRNPQAMIRETAWDGPAEIDWMLSDGAGGIFAGHGREVFRIDSVGAARKLPPPQESSSSQIPAPNAKFSATPDGVLWYWNGWDHLERYSAAKGWEEILLAFPSPKGYQCQVRPVEAGKPRLLCAYADPAYAEPANRPQGAIEAMLEWPAVSAWEPAVFPSDTIGDRPDSLWAYSAVGRDTLGLFLEADGAADWRRSVFSLGRLRDSRAQRDTIPLPKDWMGPGWGDRPSHFQMRSVFLAAGPRRTWISLGGLLAMRSDSVWSLFYPKQRSRSYVEAMRKEAREVMANAKDPIPAPVRPKRFSLRENTVSRTVPFLYTGYLLLSAIRSGPGWAGEAAWGYGGIMGGGVVGFLGAMALLGSCVNTSCGSGDLTPYVAMSFLSLPLITGIWAIESQQSRERRDRTWTRVGSSALGAITGAGMYLVFPSESEWSVTMGLTGMALGMVVGYRLAWF